MASWKLAKDVRLGEITGYHAHIGKREHEREMVLSGRFMVLSGAVGQGCLFSSLTHTAWLRVKCKCKCTVHADARAKLHAHSLAGGRGGRRDRGERGGIEK